MSDLFFAVLFGAAGTLLLVCRDRVVTSNLEAYRRWPVLRRFPILGRWYDSERFQRRQTTFGAIVLLAMAAISLIDWVDSR